MIEGLRLLPWFQEAARSDGESVLHLTDCERCKSMFNPTRAQRQAIACGFEPPVEGGRAWRPHGLKGDDPTVCIGYTRQLPEVVEVSRAYGHWDRGCLRDWTGGKRPEPNLLAAIEILASEVGAEMSYRMDEKQRKARG